MNKEDIDRLKLKKLALKQKLDATVAIQNLEQWWLPWYKTLLQHQVDHEMVYLNCVPQADRAIWIDALQQPPLATYRFSPSVIKESTMLFIHEALLRFQNTHPLRYLPALPHQISDADPGLVLQQAAATLPVHKDQWVYFFFTRFTPVLSVPFSVIQKLAPLFYDLSEDICLLSHSFEWMIFRSLEEEWLWGRKPNI